MKISRSEAIFQKREKVNGFISLLSSQRALILDTSIDFRVNFLQPQNCSLLFEKP